MGLGGLALVLARRKAASPRDDRLVQAVDEMRTRMDDLGRDLSEALERAERESKRNRFLSDLGTSIEFDELLDRVLDAGLEVPGFDAAMVALEEGGGQTTVATRGLTPEEALRNLSLRVDSPATRAFTQALVQGESLGVSIGTILRDLASDMRKRRRQAAEERAQKTPTKILFPLIVLMLPAIFIVALGPVVMEALSFLRSA